jgi:hypothetical protein
MLHACLRHQQLGDMLQLAAFSKVHMLITLCNALVSTDLEHLQMHICIHSTTVLQNLTWVDGCICLDNAFNR